MEELTADLSAFVDLVYQVWTETFGPIDFVEIGIALGIFSLFFILRGFITNVILARIAHFAERSRNEFDDILVDSLEGPVRMVPLVLGFFLATASLSLDESLTSFFTQLNKSLITFVLFWALFKATQPLGSVLPSIGGFLTLEMVDWLAKIIKGTVVLIGGAAILEIWGIAVGPLIAGLGLFGVAIALGAQDLFKNLIAGLFIIGERRFELGDWILVDGVVEGTVETIGFRTTTVRRFDKAPVYVPNASLADHAVTNFSRMTFRRIKWQIGIRYDASADQLKQVRGAIEAFLDQDPDFVKPDESATFVRLDAFGASSIDIQLYCFTRTTAWLEWLAIKERLLLKVKDIVEEAGTDFAFPSRSLYIEGSDIAPSAVLDIDTTFPK